MLWCDTHLIQSVLTSDLNNIFANIACYNQFYVFCKTAITKIL